MHRTIAFTTCALLWLASRQIHACSCIEPPALTDLFAQNRNVFAATVVQIDYRDPEGDDSYGLQRGTIRVEEVFKGLADGYHEIISPVNFRRPDMKVHKHTSCDTHGIVAGATYIVFANPGDELSVTACGHSVQFFRHDVAELRMLGKKSE